MVAVVVVAVAVVVVVIVVAKLDVVMLGFQSLGLKVQIGSSFRMKDLPVNQAEECCALTFCR